MTDAPPPPQPIVVGTDGSPQAALALEFAIEEARLRGSGLHVTYAYPAMASPLTGSTAEEYYAHIEREAKELLERIEAAAPSTEGLDVEWLGVPGNAAEVLIKATRGAAMLVVGSRGLGGFRGLVLGSVSSQCVQHAHCPVLVVREEH
jgi:nucleotide-binding universal stress UspA family protein